MCLREARERARRRALRLSAVFCVSVLALSGSLLAARSLHTPRAERAAAAVLSAEPPVPVTRNTSEVPAEQQAPSPDSPVANEAAPRGAPSSPLASAEPLAAAALAAPAPSVSVPNRAALQAALRATPVLMFSTSWCPACQRARKFFQANGLQVVDRDVDSDAQANAEFKRRSAGGKSIPLIDVDGQQLSPGFSEQATIEAVTASVSRRLGVPGVRFVPTSVPN